jgi:hypothetical protein
MNSIRVRPSGRVLCLRHRAQVSAHAGDAPFHSGRLRPPRERARLRHAGESRPAAASLFSVLAVGQQRALRAPLYSSGVFSSLPLVSRSGKLTFFGHACGGVHKAALYKPSPTCAALRSQKKRYFPERETKGNDEKKGTYRSKKQYHEEL